MNVYDGKGRPVYTGEIIGRGGEAIVYRVKGRSNLLAKIYDPAPRPNYNHKLAWMMSHPPHNPTQALEHASLAWPLGLLYDARRRLAGYSMVYIHTAVPILEVFNPRRRLETLPQFDRRYLHRAARNLAAALGALHRSGYVAGDINESNVLVTASALVTLIDTDSFQVLEQRDHRSIVHYCPVGKLEYTPPELQGKSLERFLRLPEQDAFALGVLIFQLLMEGNHPFRAQWLGSGEPPPVEARIAQGGFPYMASPPCPVRPPKNAPQLHLLHPEVSELVLRCFIDGYRNPARRPSPEMWEHAIARAEKCLIRCGKGHFYSNHLSACPRCPPPANHQASRPAEASPPIFSFRRPKPAPSSSAPAGPPPLSTAQSPAAKPPPASKPPQTAHPSARAAGRTFIWKPGRPAFIQAGLWNWARLRLYKSIAVGGGFGALAGALPGAVVGAASWSAGDAAAWSLLWMLGGVAGGVLRGWKPGYRLGLWVNQRFGWSRFWQAIGLVGGAVGGGLAGLVFGWAIFPVFVGLASGARVGLSTGRRIWQAGNQVGWERIWAGISACGAGLLGGLVAGWAGAGWIGSLADQFASSLASWMIGHSASWALVLVMISALGGAFGGAIAGIFADLFGRFSGLVD